MLALGRVETGKGVALGVAVAVADKKHKARQLVDVNLDEAYPT